jgi:hypothetical protein
MLFNMNLHKLILVGLLTAFVVQTASASEAMKAAGMSSINYSDFPGMLSPDDLGFKVLAPFIGKEDLFIKYGEGGYRRIQTVPDGLSRTHYYSGSSPVTFYRKGLDEAGEVIYVPAGSCEFKANTKDVVICMQKRGEEYLAFPIDLSLKGQALGSVRFVNFTPANLVVLLNDEKASINPGGEVVTTFESKQKTYFNFKIGAMYEDEAKMIYSKRHPFRGGMRILFIGYASRAPSGGESPFRVVSHYDKGPEIRAMSTE